MKIMTKFNLLSLGAVLIVTVSVMVVGWVIIDDILYRSESRLLRLELGNAGQTILRALNRAGVRAGAQAAAGLQADLRQKEGLRSVQLFIVETPDNRIVYHPEMQAGAPASAGFIDRMFREGEGSIEYDSGAVSFFAVFTTMEPIGWLLAISIGKVEMLERRRQFLWAIGGTTLLALGVNALVASLFGQRILRRLRTVLDCVERIEKGELSARIPAIAIRDEIGELQNGINAMGGGIELRTKERQAAEDALREREARIRRLVDANIIGIFFWHLDGGIVEANDAFLAIVGYSREELDSGQVRWTDMTPPEWRKADEQATVELLARGSNAPYEKEYIRKDGSRVPVLLGGAFLGNSRDSGIAFVLDLSERKRDEVEIKRLNAALQRKIVELQDAQDELVRKEKLAILGQLSGSVGHELRNPLGVMNNAIFFLNMVLTDADETVKDYLGIIKKEIDTSLRIITDLLDFARTKTPQIQTVAARALINESLGRCTIPAAVELQNGVPENLPPLKIDPLQMGQVLQNLIVNGVQAMPAGGVLTLRGGLDGQGMVALTVADTGEGITAANMQKLFQPLFTTKPKGIGLGLVVCRNLTEANGGRIAVSSEPGKGTMFTLVLPVVEEGEKKDGIEGSILQ